MDGFLNDVSNVVSVNKQAWNKGLKGWTNSGSFKKGHKVPQKWIDKQKKTFKAPSGNDHPNWKGGCEFYWRRQARKIVDKHTGLQLTELNMRDNGIVIHHIDSDIKNNNPNNLIVMAREMHSRMHYLKGDYPEMDRTNKMRRLT